MLAFQVQSVQYIAPGYEQALPPTVANASREDLQRMLMDSVRKTKARDKRITELTAEKDGLLAAQAASAPAENGGTTDHLQQQLQVAAPCLALGLRSVQAMQH